MLSFALCFVMRYLYWNIGKELQTWFKFCPTFCLSELKVGAVNLFQLHVFALNYTFLHSITLFCTDLELIDRFLTNQNAEIVACILLLEFLRYPCTKFEWKYEPLKLHLIVRQSLNPKWYDCDKGHSPVLHCASLLRIFYAWLARALENGGFFLTDGPRQRGKSSFSQKRIRWSIIFFSVVLNWVVNFST